ncbi:MAG TPA: glycosyltransferase family 2 protein [Geminicoccaceae bacterium]|nr:glycosyltransferase family 2 protein [Geminicoccaceae bacterium]
MPGEREPTTTTETACGGRGPVGDGAISVSVVVPAFDEAESLPVLAGRVLAAAAEHRLDLRQLIFVDDGSRDESWAVMRRLAAEHAPVVRAIRLRRNFGKATALNVGIGAATGDVIVTMDADLQDDPAELPRFLAKIGDGYDLVSGWKQVRHDPVSKTLPSRLFNLVTAKLTGVPLRDFNCGYKAYRREVFDNVELYGELHRYVPVLADSLGFRIAELPVQHHPRRFGQSKYGWRRFLRGFVDLLTVLSITRYARRPGHLFGGAGSVLLLFGLAILTYLSGLKLFTGAEIGGRPLLLLGILSVIVGLQILFFGILAELINSRTRGPEPAALVRETATGDDGD